MNATPSHVDDLNKGHRKRLRERLFASSSDSLQDYELLEMLLFSAYPRRDMKPLAKTLLSEFNGLWSVLNATPERLIAFGLSETAAATLITAAAIAVRATKEQVMRRPLLKSWDDLMDYCRMTMAAETKEQFRIIFLDRKNALIADEVLQRGTIDHTPVYPREVVQRALELSAGALVLLHNHPSGDPTPSKEDIAMTRAIIDACKPLGINVHDHVIIGKGGKTTSFKALALF